MMVHFIFWLTFKYFSCNDFNIYDIFIANRYFIDLIKLFLELDFWFKRIKNLESIYQQIKDPRVKKMGSILELTESSYSENFKTIWKNVIAG